MKLLILLTLTFAAASSSAQAAGLKIYYIRHAEGGHNVKRAWEKKGIPKSEWPAYVGNPNVFTPKGVNEVVTATEKLQEHSFDFIATSPQWRARNTILPYLKATNQKAEIWPELTEGYGMVDILSEGLPEIGETILNKGKAIVLPEAEVDFFQIRQGGENDYKKSPRSNSRELEVAYMKHVSQHAIELIESRFGGSDKSILLAGHNSAGVSLLKLLIQKEPTGEARRGLKNISGWMVEQQGDGSYDLKIYNDKPYVHDNSAR